MLRMMPTSLLRIFWINHKLCMEVIIGVTTKKVLLILKSKIKLMYNSKYGTIYVLRGGFLEFQ